MPLKHKEIFSGMKSDSFRWSTKPGEVQVDFGSADFYENGTRVSGKYLRYHSHTAIKAICSFSMAKTWSAFWKDWMRFSDISMPFPMKFGFDNAKTIVTKSNQRRWP